MRWIARLALAAILSAAALGAQAVTTLQSFIVPTPVIGDDHRSYGVSLLVTPILLGLHDAFTIDIAFAAPLPDGRDACVDEVGAPCFGRGFELTSAFTSADGKSFQALVGTVVPGTLGKDLVGYSIDLIQDPSFALTGIQVTGAMFGSDPQGGFIFGPDLSLGFATVPEAPAWVSMIGGFALLGTSMRRRQVRSRACASH